MQPINNPESDKKSLMMRHVPLCSGAQTGRQCKHYWGMVKRVDSDNKVALRDGEKLRFCLLDTADTTFLGDGGMDMPHYCTQYVSSSRKYDPKYEDYNPLTPEEITLIESGQALSVLAVSDSDGFLGGRKLFSIGSK